MPVISIKPIEDSNSCGLDRQISRLSGLAVDR
jgi:hypothetical protein